MKTLLGVALGIPVGWGARSMIAHLENTGHLPSVDEALALLWPIWDEMDGVA